MRLLRWVSSEENHIDQVAGPGVTQTTTDIGDVELERQRRSEKVNWELDGGTPLPSRELLITLRWAIKVEARKKAQRAALNKQGQPRQKPQQREQQQEALDCARRWLVRTRPPSQKFFDGIYYALTGKEAYHP